MHAIFLAFLEWELVASKPSCLIPLWTCSSFALHFPAVSSPRPWEWGSPPALPSPSQASKHEAVYRRDGASFVSFPRLRRPGYKSDARLVPEHHLAKHVEFSALLRQSFAWVVGLKNRVPFQWFLTSGQDLQGKNNGGNCCYPPWALQKAPSKPPAGETNRIPKKQTSPFCLQTLPFVICSRGKREVWQRNSPPTRSGPRVQFFHTEGNWVEALIYLHLIRKGTWCPPLNCSFWDFSQLRTAQKRLVFFMMRRNSWGKCSRPRSCAMLGKRQYFKMSLYFEMIGGVSPNFHHHLPLLVLLFKHHEGMIFFPANLSLVKKNTSEKGSSSFTSPSPSRSASSIISWHFLVFVWPPRDQTMMNDAPISSPCFWHHQDIDCIAGNPLCFFDCKAISFLFSLGCVLVCPG